MLPAGSLNHALVRLFRDQQHADATVFVDYSAAFSFVALAVVAIAAWPDHGELTDSVGRGGVPKDDCSLHAWQNLSE